MTKTPVKAEPKRIFIVEDHPVVRMGLKQLLQMDPDFEVCGEAEQVDEAIEKIRDTHPQVVLVDLALPGTNGMELIRYIKQHWVGMKTIVVSTYDETIYGPVAAEAGADYYINKQEAVDRIVEVIHSLFDPSPQDRDRKTKESHWFG